MCAHVCFAGRQPSDDAVAQRVQRNAADVEGQLFDKSGTADVVVKTMASLLSRPAMRELIRSEKWHDLIVDDEQALLKSDRDVIPRIIENVKTFLAVSCNRGGKDRETDNAIRAAAAALVGSEDDMAGKKSACMRLLGLTHSRVVSAIQQREEFASSASGRWKRVEKSECANKYGASVKGVIDRCLHSKAKPDNNSKRGQIKVPIGIDDDGKVIFDLHPPHHN